MNTYHVHYVLPNGNRISFDIEAENDEDVAYWAAQVKILVFKDNAAAVEVNNLMEKFKR